MMGIKYESLLRKAFGFSSNGQYGDRSCDPADLAEAGLFTDVNLASVKIGTGYAFKVMSTAIINEKEGALEDGEYDRLNLFIERTISCASVNELSTIIAEYEESVIDRYFDINEGNIRFR